jgi:hypothetical protein
VLAPQAFINISNVHTTFSKERHLSPELGEWGIYKPPKWLEGLRHQSTKRVTVSSHTLLRLCTRATHHTNSVGGHHSVGGNLGLGVHKVVHGQPLSHHVPGGGGRVHRGTPAHGVGTGQATRQASKVCQQGHALTASAMCCGTRTPTRIRCCRVIRSPRTAEFDTETRAASPPPRATAANPPGAARESHTVQPHVHVRGS